MSKPWVPVVKPKPEVLSAAAVKRLLKEEAAQHVSPKIAAEHTASERSIDEAFQDAQEATWTST